MDDAFVKRDSTAPPDFFTAEARGLRWLAQVRDGVAVVGVRGVGRDHIVLDRLAASTPGPEQADDLGRRLARTHAAGASTWGADEDGYIGPLPLPNGPFGSCAELWWEGRVEPYLAAAVDAGSLRRADADAIGAAVARGLPDIPEQAPSRIHGDLWSGNVVWTERGAVLVDAGAAHGGHREADLAMLALFGLPHLDRVLRVYDQTWPLAEGWQRRLPFWQLHPLLVHVVLFGGGYVARTRQAAAAVP